MRRWAEDKYHLPWTHEAIQSQTLYDLLASFWEDFYVKHSLEAKKVGTGEVVFKTGDPMIDKWEDEISRGLVPDLFEALPQSHREKWKREQEQKRKVLEQSQRAEIDPEGFTETY